MGARARPSARTDPGSIALRPTVVALRGHSGSGKTTLITRLIPRLQALGLSVSTIKQTHHDIQLDTEGKDTWKHAQAGAELVVLSSTKETTFIAKDSAFLDWPGAFQINLQEALATTAADSHVSAKNWFNTVEKWGFCSISLMRVKPRSWPRAKTHPYR